jgi:hypothetical protein
MTYDDGGGEPAMPMLGGRRFNLEGLIPLILLVIIGVASLNYFGVIDVPYLPKGSSRIQVLIIGEPSLGEKVVLDNLSYMMNYRVRDATTFSNAASEELHQYDIVILDQASVGSDHSVTIGLAEAIKTYVKKGGKLVVVMNSGIYQNVGFAGMTSADVVGWKANFGALMPAECVLGSDNVPTCADGREVTVMGRIYQQDFDHPIMEGIPMAPPTGEVPYALKTFAIQADEGANTIAYIKAENTPQTFSAILEKKNFPFGTVVYFNYDPGLTPGIFKNTIFYLK